MMNIAFIDLSEPIQRILLEHDCDTLAEFKQYFSKLEKERCRTKWGEIPSIRLHETLVKQYMKIKRELMKHIPNGYIFRATLSEDIPIEDNLYFLTKVSHGVLHETWALLTNICGCNDITIRYDQVLKEMEKVKSRLSALDHTKLTKNLTNLMTVGDDSFDTIYETIKVKAELQTSGQEIKCLENALASYQKAILLCEEILHSTSYVRNLNEHIENVGKLISSHWKGIRSDIILSYAWPRGNSY